MELKQCSETTTTTTILRYYHIMGVLVHGQVLDQTERSLHNYQCVSDVGNSALRCSRTELHFRKPHVTSPANAAMYLVQLPPRATWGKKGTLNMPAGDACWRTNNPAKGAN